MPETVQNREVSGAVLEPEDYDTALARLAEVERENQELKSRIGKQVQVAGDRTKNLETTVERLARELEEERKDRALAQARAQWDRMTPNQRQEAEAKMTAQEVQALRMELQELKTRDADKVRIDAVVEEARKEGFDLSLLDTSSYLAVKASYDVAERKFLKDQLQSLKKGQTQETEEKVEEAIRSVQRRVAAPGAPASPGKAGKGVPAAVDDLQRQFDALKAKRGHPGNGTKMMDLQIQAGRLGYKLT